MQHKIIAYAYYIQQYIDTTGTHWHLKTNLKHITNQSFGGYMQQSRQKQVTSRIHHFLDKKEHGDRLSDSIADWFLKPRNPFGSDMTDQYEALPWKGGADSK